MPTKLACFTRRCVVLSQKAVGNDPDEAVEFGDGGYADWVIVALHGLREYLDHPYRRLLDVLQEVPGIAEKLGLTPDDLPDFTTVCTRNQDLKMAVWRVLLRLSAALHDLGEVQAIDATGYERHSASQHYANRVDYTFEAVKTTVLVECETGVVLDVDCSMKQPHDTQIGWQVLTRNLDQLETVAADKDYDWDALRQKLREAGVRPIINHREFWSLDTAHNARQNKEIYHLRSNVESTFFALRHRFSDTLRSRTWFGQYRELLLKAAARNTELAVRSSTP